LDECALKDSEFFDPVSGFGTGFFCAKKCFKTQFSGFFSSGKKGIFEYNVQDRTA